MDIQTKIKEYIKERKISFREFAKMCGLPNSTLQSICERGIFSATFQNACKIAAVLEVSVGDFVDGAGEFSLSESERGMIEKFRAIDLRSQRSVEALLLHEHSLAKAQKEEFKPLQFKTAQADYIQISKRKEKTTAIKVFLQPAAAGLGSYVDDEYFEEMQLANVPALADFGVRIAGDSMQPQICDGDIVFVKKQDSISEGEIGIYIIDGDAFCKKLVVKNNGCYLHSLNPKYQDFILPDGAHLVGKVIL